MMVNEVIMLNSKHGVQKITILIIIWHDNTCPFYLQETAFTANPWNIFYKTFEAH